MANKASPKYANIARPYALAAFEFARDKNDLANWNTFLLNAANIAQDHTVKKLLNDPQRSSEQLFKVFDGILQNQMNADQKNFLRLLEQHNRWLALPEIYQLFESYYTNLQNVSSVTVVTAVEATESFKQKLAQALTKRMKQEVKLQCEIDPQILGGAIIHMGDKVIDGSIRGKLTRLLEFSLR